MDLKALIRDYLRIIRIARKPGKEEFVTSTKVTSIGLLIIGLIGFLIFLAYIGGCAAGIGFLC